jgi:uncharacterized protein YlxW (UPF0749 family)
LKAKTSYRCCCIKLIVERLEAEYKKLEAEYKKYKAEYKKLDIRIEAEQKKAQQREVESSIEVVGKLDIAVEVANTKSKLEVEDSL